MCLRLRVIGLAILLSYMGIATAQEHLKVDEFQSTPQSTKVHTWWHWMQDRITKSGITKDLESMKEQGIVQATILNVSLPVTKLADVPPVYFDSPEWYDMFNWALQEAKRLDINIGVHNCDGWSTSGGPWVTADESMKQYAWSKTNVQGGQELNIQLPVPPKLKNYYRDYAVVAIPLNEPENSFQSKKLNIVLNKDTDAAVVSDGNPFSSIVLKDGDVIGIELKEKLKVEQLNFHSFIPDSYKSWMWGDVEKIGGKFTLYSSSDNIEFNKVSDLELRGISETKLVSIPKISAQFFRLECHEVTNNYPLSERRDLVSNRIRQSRKLCVR